MNVSKSSIIVAVLAFLGLVLLAFTRTEPDPAEPRVSPVRQIGAGEKDISARPAPASEKPEQPKPNILERAPELPYGPAGNNPYADLAAKARKYVDAPLPEPDENNPYHQLMLEHQQNEQREY